MDRTDSGGAGALNGTYEGGGVADGHSQMAGLLGIQDILLDLHVANKHELFDAVDQHVAHAHGLPKGAAAIALTNRERIGSTGLGEGVAVPHARLRQLGRVGLLYVRLASPIAFDAPDGHPVKDVLVLLVPEQACQQHLDILAEMTHMFPNRRFRQRLHQCVSAQEVWQLFAGWSA